MILHHIPIQPNDLIMLGWENSVSSYSSYPYDSPQPKQLQEGRLQAERLRTKLREAQAIVWMNKMLRKPKVHQL